eukprot:349906-Chlamydomonas_euryale.AAC.5
MPPCAPRRCASHVAVWGGRLGARACVKMRRGERRAGLSAPRHVAGGVGQSPLYPPPLFLRRDERRTDRAPSLAAPRRTCRRPSHEENFSDARTHRASAAVLDRGGGSSSGRR